MGSCARRAGTVNMRSHLASVYLVFYHDVPWCDGLNRDILRVGIDSRKDKKLGANQLVSVAEPEV